MLKTTIKGIYAHKLRLVLTALSVMIGVAFIAGTYIFTDTIDRTFADLFENVYAGQDVIVQSETEYSSGYESPPPFDESIIQTVRAVPGVAAAEGSVEGFAVIYDKDGDAIVPMGPPTLGGSWVDDERFAGNAEMREGRGPETPGEVVIDAATAAGNDFHAGDQVTIQTAVGVDEYSLVGIVGFGETDNLAGATYAAFVMSEAQELFHLEGKLSVIAAIGDEGVTPDMLRDRVAAALPEGIEAVTGADQSAETTEQLSEALGFLRTALLIFALVAVFVASFIIQNTFRIIVRQRQRELALMRAVGATGSQVVMMVVFEAALVGLVASVIGIALGFLIAIGLTAVMGAIGIDMPSTAAPLASRTILVSLAVGVLVTVGAAVLPAIRASRIPPVAALQDTDVRLRMSPRKRVIAGLVSLLIGGTLIVLGLFARAQFGPLNELALVGLGALVVFVAVSMLSSTVVRPIASVLGLPLKKVDRVTGALAVDNSIRKPRRTATTASALMIGLALVAFFFVLGDSIKASTGAAIERGLRADYVVSVDNFAGGFSTELGDTLRATPEIGAVTALRYGYFGRDGADGFLMALDAETADETIFLDIQAGSLEALAAGGVFVHESVADEESWSVGDRIPMVFSATGLQQIEIVGIYGEQNVVQAPFLLGMDCYRENYLGGSSDTDFVLAIKAADGVSPDAARAAVEAAAADYPNVTVRDQAEYRESQEEQVNTMLVMFNALLLLAVIIALVGIANTLRLSIFERTREIGLLRAVGMTRWQVRRMVLWESIIVAVIGALLGIVVGLVFGAAVTAALSGEGITELSVPIAQIALLVVFGGIVGVIASVFPARKAARLNVLEAISYE